MPAPNACVTVGKPRLKTGLTGWRDAQRLRVRMLLQRTHLRSFTIACNSSSMVTGCLWLFTLMCT